MNKKKRKNGYKLSGYCREVRLNSQHFERKRKPFCEVDHIIFVFAHLLKFFCEMHHIFELFPCLISVFILSCTLSPTWGWTHN